MSTLVHQTHTFRRESMQMHVRKDTGDVDVLYSIIARDEYGLSKLPPLEGYALDVGAHIGSVAIPLLIDNPGLVVVAVEPVPENADILSRNAELNGVERRLLIDQRALNTPVVFYGWGGRNHWVGNLDEGHYTTTVLCGETTLTEVLGDYLIREPALVKIDCEGYEWGIFTDPAVARCPLILGEFHDDHQERGRDRLRALLGPTHSVKTQGWTFRAELL